MHTSTPAQSVELKTDSQNRSRPHHAVRPTFGVACWLLAMLAFAQLITVGTALTVRASQPIQSKARVAPVFTTGEPIAPRSVEQILADAARSSVKGGRLSDEFAHGPVRVHPSSVTASPSAPSSAIPFYRGPEHSLPMIANPRVERLVQESRNLHLEGDMMRAMLKLDEASRIDSSECAVIYEQGLLFENMGISTKAADRYLKIQQMGLVKGGRYFTLASDKLSKGMTTMSVRRNTIAIGPMTVNRGSGVDAGKKVQISVTLLARPDKVINPDDVNVDVHIYDQVNGGEIKKATRNAQIDSRWADTQVDWADVGNEETLRVSYVIPSGDLAEEHLLGRREFYGYVVELLYKGEVVDQQAYPRRLHSIHSKAMAPFQQDDMGMPWLPSDENSLLPSKDEKYFDGDPLPSR